MRGACTLYVAARLSGWRVVYLRGANR